MLLETYSIIAHYTFLLSLGNCVSSNFDQTPGPCYGGFVTFASSSSCFAGSAFGCCGGNWCQGVDTSYCSLFSGGTASCPSSTQITQYFANNGDTCPTPGCGSCGTTQNSWTPATCSGGGCQFWIGTLDNVGNRYRGAPIDPSNIMVTEGTVNMPFSVSMGAGASNYCNYWTADSTPLGTRHAESQWGTIGIDGFIGNLAFASLIAIAVKEGLKMLALLSTLCWPYMRCAGCSSC